MHNGKFELEEGQERKVKRFSLYSSLLANFSLLAIYFWRLTKRSETSKKDKAKEQTKRKAETLWPAAKTKVRTQINS